MKVTFGDLWELVGDCLIVGLGLVLIFVFFCIEVLGYYGVEQNAVILWLEKYLGFPIAIIGACLFVADVKRVMDKRGKKNEQCS